MKDLKCGLKNCKFNQGYCCCARAIDVKHDTGCATYTFDATKAKSMFEAGSDFTKANYAVDTSVACTAECIFQKNRKCIANGITVMNENGTEAKCLSFIKK